jgi:uncharacterized protein GlcG (DUF336 family)
MADTLLSTGLNLAQAEAIIDGAFAAARAAGGKPLSIGVFDAGGALIAFKRSDNSPALRLEIVTGKAVGGLLMGVNSRRLGEMAAERPHFIAAAIASSGGRVTPVAGGVLIKSSAGLVVGAVGISGDTSDRDEQFAIAGIQAAGLVAHAD